MPAAPAAPEISVQEVSTEVPGGGAVRANIDSPTVAEGVLTIPGWAFGPEARAVVAEATDEAGSCVRAAIDRRRPDVASNVPGAPPNAGFALVLRLAGGSGISRVGVCVELDDGTRVSLGRVVAEVGGEGGEPPRWEPAARAIEGREGWLFLAGDRTDVIGQHTGRRKLSLRSRQRWRRVLRSRVKAARELGTTDLTVVAPDKEAVLSEYLPDSARPAARRPVHQYLEIAEQVGALAVYPLEELRTARNEMLVFRPRDSHWTDHGAYVAYAVTCEALRRLGVAVETLDRARIRWIRTPASCDLGGGTAGTETTLVGRIDSPRARVAFDNGVEGSGRIVVWESPEPGPKGLLYGGPFAAIALRFFAESFSRLVFVQTRGWPLALVRAERPAAVIGMPVERSLIQVPRDMDTDAWLTDPSQKRSPREREADEQAIRLAEASFEELRALGLSVTQAKRVLRHRDRGELRRVADLAGVPGLPQSLHEELERKLRD